MTQRCGYDEVVGRGAMRSDRTYRDGQELRTPPCDRPAIYCAHRVYVWSGHFTSVVFCALHARAIRRWGHHVRRWKP